MLNTVVVSLLDAVLLELAVDWLVLKVETVLLLEAVSLLVAVD